MAVEVVDSNLAVALESKNEANGSLDSGKLGIKFGSHGADEPATAETEPPHQVIPESNLPKNATDDWPEPTKVHSFYMVKYRAIEDQNVRAKLDVAEKELQKKNQARFQIVEKLKGKRGERAQVIAQIRTLSVENKQFRSFMDEKRKEMEPLQQALGKLRGGSSGTRERGSGICSSEEELNALIKSYQYRIQHESITLNEEKQILREIKALEGTRANVVANAAERTKIQDALGAKESIQDQVKLMGGDLDGVRKEKQAVHAKLKQFDEEKAIIDKEIKALEDELTAMTEKRDQTFESIKEMRKGREEGNAPFYQNRTVLTKAKVLAANKEVEALKELSETEVENFMSLWNSDKSFRDDYQKRILSSLDMRQLSRDGRMRNPGEKPLVVRVEAPAPPQPAVVKTTVPKDNLVISPQEDSSEQKIKKTEKSDAKTENEGKKKTKDKIEPQEEEEEFFHVEKLPKKEVIVDEKKLKELKREEEITKRIQTEERKKKLAEKAAAKAAIKAQKEAEKKLKDREKKARKKSGAPPVDQESEEPVEEVAEAEKVEEKFETPVPHKNKDRKENPVKLRGRPRGGVAADSVPKALLKRKKGTNYMQYAVPAAAFSLVLVILAVGYTYMS